MKKILTPHRTLSLDVANISVEIACSNSKTLDLLSRHYRGFTSSSGNDFKIRIHINRSNIDKKPEMTINQQGHMVNFVSQGYKGWLDIDSGRGELDIQDNFAFEGIDYLLRIAFALLVFNRGGLMLHAAGIIRGGRAFLFLGHSGAGKTTVARLSSKNIILNDDLVVLMPSDGTWQVYGTPFWNPTQVRPNPGQAPLSGFFWLVQARDVYLEPISPGKALAEFISNVPVIPENPVFTLEFLRRSEQILHGTSNNRLHFLPDDSFWNVIDSSISDKKGR